MDYSATAFTILTRVRRTAQKKAERAQASGLLVAPDRCERCGADGPFVAHHRDYARPYDVTWLCLQCHAQVHNAIRAALPPVKAHKRPKTTAKPVPYTPETRGKRRRRSP